MGLRILAVRRKEGLAAISDGSGAHHARVAIIAHAGAACASYAVGCLHGCLVPGQPCDTARLDAKVVFYGEYQCRNVVVQR